MSELKSILSENGISPKEAVSTLRPRFPSFDKTLLSKCQNPDKYGVVLHPDGLKALQNAFSFSAEQETKGKKHKSGGHRLRCRISCRLEDEDYAALQRRVSADGYITMQDWLSNTVQSYLTGGDENA